MTEKQDSERIIKQGRAAVETDNAVTTAARRLGEDLLEFKDLVDARMLMDKRFSVGEKDHSIGWRRD